MLKVIYTVKDRWDNIVGVYTLRETAEAALRMTIACTGGGQMYSKAEFTQGLNFGKGAF